MGVESVFPLLSASCICGVFLRYGIPSPKLRVLFPLKMGKPGKGDSELGNLHFLGATPPKTNVEPENEALEEEISIKNHHFQVPC